MSKFGLPCAFFGKSDSYQFSTREIYAVLGKRCLQFFLAVLVTSPNGVPSFHFHQRAYMWWGIYTHKIISFFMFVALKWLKTFIKALK